jgi:hypothetical protein
MKKPKKEVRIVIHVTREMADDLKSRSIARDLTVGEIIRQAVRLSAFGDQQTAATNKRPAPAEIEHRERSFSQPSLISANGRKG